jgi:hypothetical protein
LLNVCEDVGIGGAVRRSFGIGTVASEIGEQSRSRRLFGIQKFSSQKQ